MDLTAFHPVSLLLVWTTLVAARVEPPTNVTLHCHNLHNVLKWNYGQFTSGLRFRVDYASYLQGPNVLWVDPPALQADLSFLSNLRDDYLLTVTAVNGQNESEPSPPGEGITFSYSQNSPAKQKCFADLPSVNVTAQPHDNVLVRFQHPWLFYRHKLSGSARLQKVRKKKSHDVERAEPLPVFAYDVMIINQKDQYDFTCEEGVCEETVQVVAPQDKHCLEIKGDLQQMLVKTKQEYCVPRFPEVASFSYIYIVVSCVLILVLAAIVCWMVYHKRTRPATPLPDSMRINNTQMQPNSRPAPEPLSVLEVEPASPTPLLTTTEEEDGLESTPPVPEYEFRLPIGVQPQDEGVADVGDEERPNDENSEYMHGNDLEEDEAPPSDYERRAVLVELEPGELTKGYRG